MLSRKSLFDFSFSWFHWVRRSLLLQNLPVFFQPLWFCTSQVFFFFFLFCLISEKSNWMNMITQSEVILIIRWCDVDALKSLWTLTTLFFELSKRLHKNNSKALSQKNIKLTHDTAIPTSKLSNYLFWHLNQYTNTPICVCENYFARKKILCTTQRTLQKIYFHDIAVLLKMQLKRTLPMSQRHQTTLMEVGFIASASLPQHCLLLLTIPTTPNSLSISLHHGIPIVKSRKTNFLAKKNQWTKLDWRSKKAKWIVSWCNTRAWYLYCCTYTMIW